MATEAVTVQGVPTVAAIRFDALVSVEASSIRREQVSRRTSVSGWARQMVAAKAMAPTMILNVLQSGSGSADGDARQQGFPEGHGFGEGSADGDGYTNRWGYGDGFADGAGESSRNHFGQGCGHGPGCGSGDGKGDGKGYNLD
jgi:hypothetical protein